MGHKSGDAIQRSTSEAGLVLIEFFIALLLMTVALFGLATVFTRTVSANASTRHSTAATALAQRTIEELKRQALVPAGYDALSSTPPAPSASNPYYAISTNITDNTPLPGLKQAEVVVTWENGQHHLSLATLLRRP